MLISYIFGSAYKQWLEKIMFLVLCFNPEKDALDESTLNDFLALLNSIVSASTISRVRLRHQPKIDSISFVEIPRNTTIKIFGTSTDQHWVKVRVLLDDTESESYLQLAYIVKSYQSIQKLHLKYRGIYSSISKKLAK